MGWKPVEAKMALRYDNQFTGFVSAITTQGTASAVLRAAGPVGLHSIEMSGTGVNGGGYLNNQQSPYAHIYPENGSFRFWFRVTEDGGLPPDTFDWPDRDRVKQLGASDPITTSAGPVDGSGSAVSLDKLSGPIGAEVNVIGSQLPANEEFDLVWGGILADNLGTPGWDRVPQKNVQQNSFGKFSSDGTGDLAARFEVPDELGGWHAVQLVGQDGTIAAEGEFFVERSLVSVSARQVRAGDTVVLEFKGIGWTDIDNGFAVTYDNAFFGYACGFNSGGTIILNLPIVGEPGTHLIDLYPMTHLRSTGKPGWVYSMPQLTFRQDHPGLSVGYDVAAIRLAIEVIE